MIREVVICQKKSKNRNELVTNLNKILEEEKLKFYIGLVSDDVNEIVESVEKFKRDRIFIIHTEFRLELSGFRLAEYVRMFDSKSYLILITEKEKNCDKVFQGKMEALDYINISDSNQSFKELRENMIYISKHEKVE